MLDIDGARVDFGDGAWGLCRASNTGPVLVLRFEALTSERLAAIRAEVEAVVEAAVAGERDDLVTTEAAPREEPWTIRRVLAWADRRSQEARQHLGLASTRSSCSARCSARRA